MVWLIGAGRLKPRQDLKQAYLLLLPLTRLLSHYPITTSFFLTKHSLIDLYTVPCSADAITHLSYT